MMAWARAIENMTVGVDDAINDATMLLEYGMIARFSLLHTLPLPSPRQYFQGFTPYRAKGGTAMHIDAIVRRISARQNAGTCRRIAAYCLPVSLRQSTALTICSPIMRFQRLRAPQRWRAHESLPPALLGRCSLKSQTRLPATPRNTYRGATPD